MDYYINQILQKSIQPVPRNAWRLERDPLKYERAQERIQTPKKELPQIVKDDSLLPHGIFKDDNDWIEISNILGVETKILKNKWLVMVKPQVKNAPWTQEEDQILKSLIDPIEKNHNWTQVATSLAELTQNSSFRNAKQIRERWNNYLNPTLKKSEWEEVEDISLLESVLIYGKKWSQISQIMGCRTESQVKNRFNSISNRLKKTYGENYPEETLIQMEIHSLQGFSNSQFNIPPLSSAGTSLNSVQPSGNYKNQRIENKERLYPQSHHHSQQNIQHKLEYQDDCEDQGQFNQQRVFSHHLPFGKGYGEANSSDTLQVNLRRIQSCSVNSAQGTVTENVFSNQSSPQFSNTHHFQDPQSIIQLDNNIGVSSTINGVIALPEIVAESSQHMLGLQKLEEGTSIQYHNESNYQITAQNNNGYHVFNSNSFKQEPLQIFSSGQEIGEFPFSTSQNNYPEENQQQIISQNKIGILQNNQVYQNNNCHITSNNFSPNGQLYEGLFPNSSSEAANNISQSKSNNNGSGLYIEDWGFNPVLQGSRNGQIVSSHISYFQQPHNNLEFNLQADNQDHDNIPKNKPPQGGLYTANNYQGDSQKPFCYQPNNFFHQTNSSSNQPIYFTEENPF